MPWCLSFVLAMFLTMCCAKPENNTCSRSPCTIWEIGIYRRRLRKGAWAYWEGSKFIHFLAPLSVCRNISYVILLKEPLWYHFQVFSPLVEKCKQYGRAMRIGTNHGSLSDRIMSYYGDSPRGMVIISFLHIYLTTIWRLHDIFCILISGWVCFGIC